MRVAREKLGAPTSAEAARRFAALQEGTEFPQSGVSDLALTLRRRHQGLVLEPAGQPSTDWLGDTHGALSPDQPLTARQTLLTIFAVSLGSIVGLLLLVACAEGIRQLVSN